MMKMKNTKIIKLDDKRKNIVNYIKNLLEYAQRGEIEKIAVVAILEDKEKKLDTMEKDILLGFYNLSLNEKFYLMSHLQSELSYKLVEENVDNLIEIINK